MKKKSTHIVYIITKLELGGAQKICLALKDKIPTDSVTTTIITGSDGILAEQVQKDDSFIFLPSFKREVSISGITAELKTVYTLYKTLKKIKRTHPYVIVHTHSTKAGILGRWAAFFAGIQKRIHSIHGFAFHPHQSRTKWILIYIIELITSLITTHFICVSSEDVKTGIKLFPRFSRKHSIIRAAVEIEQFYIPAKKSALIQKELFIFGTIACFKTQKNLLDLLKAFHRVHQNNRATRLEIIGDGILRPLLEEWISEHHLTDAVTLHGWKTSVAPYLQIWDAFVLSSLWEGLPCAVIEARLAKLPVIAYNTGGIHDVIFNGKNGYLIEQKNWVALADAMKKIIENDSLHTQLANFSDQFSDFSMHTMITQHRRLYERL